MEKITVSKIHKRYFEDNKIDEDEWIGKYIEVDKIIKTVKVDEDNIRRDIEYVKNAIDAIKYVINDKKDNDNMNLVLENINMIIKNGEDNKKNILEKVEGRLNSISDVQNSVINNINTIISNLKSDTDNKVIDRVDNKLDKFFDIQSSVIKNINSSLENTFEIINTKNNNKIIDNICNIVNNDDNNNLQLRLTKLFEEYQNKNKELLNNVVNKDIQEMKIINKNIQTEFTEFKNKFLKSKTKGEAIENVFYDILQKEFYQIGNVECKTNDAHSGDFHIDIDGLPNIIVEVKDYTGIVPKTEVDKFINDVKLNDSWGIMVSMSSRIANTRDFEIVTVDNINNNLVCYIHDCQLNPRYISIAIELMKTVFSRFEDSLEPDSTFSISKKDILDIKSEYDNYISAIDESCNLIKNARDRLKNFHLTKIQSLLFDKVIVSSKSSSDFYCRLCDKYIKGKSNFNRHNNSISHKQRESS